MCLFDEFCLRLFPPHLNNYTPHRYFHAFGYTACLVLSGFHIFRIFHSWGFFLAVAAVFVGRVFLNINKYVLWTAFAAVLAVTSGAPAVPAPLAELASAYVPSLGGLGLDAYVPTYVTEMATFDIASVGNWTSDLISGGMGDYLPLRAR